MLKTYSEQSESKWGQLNAGLYLFALIMMISSIVTISGKHLTREFWNDSFLLMAGGAVGLTSRYKFVRWLCAVGSLLGLACGIYYRLKT